MTSDSASTTVRDATRSSSRTEPQPADDDVPAGGRRGSGSGRRVGQRRQPETGEGHLGGGEQARHEELVPELDLEHVDPERGLDPASQADLAHGGARPGELLEPCGHPPSSGSGPP
jgi:hypothetical protein